MAGGLIQIVDRCKTAAANSHHISLLRCHHVAATWVYNELLNWTWDHL